ncbi:MAG: antitoxin VapB family protein [Candidatus Aenigmarchaeota archaeon]|nr:antitoxin VapB family protein [Candidatus Aenigmarchaeota archaeon]MDI6722360.1 antitoxin VapB family protein [Candidatus Aenigmarchaeota archaeon]
MTKVISLSDEAYTELEKLKNAKDSFSDVVIRLSKKEKRPLSDFFGKWSDKESLDWLEKSIKRTRKETKMRDVEF